MFQQIERILSAYSEWSQFPIYGKCKWLNYCWRLTPNSLVVASSRNTRHPDISSATVKCNREVAKSTDEKWQTRGAFNRSWSWHQVLQNTNFVRDIYTWNLKNHHRKVILQCALPQFQIYKTLSKFLEENLATSQMSLATNTEWCQHEAYLFRPMRPGFSDAVSSVPSKLTVVGVIPCAINNSLSIGAWVYSSTFQFSNIILW